MTNLLEHIVLATDIATTADIPVVLHPYQVRYLIDRAEKAEAENAALRERVTELELQVSLLTPSSVEYLITGSDNTTAFMTEEECTAIFGWQCQRCGRTCHEEHCPCEHDGEGVA